MTTPRLLSALAALATALAAALAGADEARPLPRVEKDGERVVLRLRAGSFETRAKSGELDPRLLAAILGEGSGEVFAGGETTEQRAPPLR